MPTSHACAFGAADRLEHRAPLPSGEDLRLVEHEQVRGEATAGAARTGLEQQPRAGHHLDEVPRFIATGSGDDELRRLDLPDLLVFMLYTGCRIGEACALRWSRVDLKAGEVTFTATAVRVPREGMLVQEHGKTTSSTRTIALPPEAVELLEGRDRSGELEFPSPLGKLRDLSNTNGAWQRNRERLGYPNLTSHALRKTCATALDVAGVSARGIAEYLGHRRPSMTQDVYMSRNVGSAEAAAHLSRMFGGNSDSVTPLRRRTA